MGGTTCTYCDKSFSQKPGTECSTTGAVSEEQQWVSGETRWAQHMMGNGRRQMGNAAERI